MRKFNDIDEIRISTKEGGISYIERLNELYYDWLSYEMYRASIRGIFNVTIFDDEKINRYIRNIPDDVLLDLKEKGYLIKIKLRYFRRDSIFISWENKIGE